MNFPSLRIPWRLALGLAMAWSNGPAAAQSSTVMGDSPRWFDLAPMPLGVFDASAAVSGRLAVVSGGLNGLGMTSRTIQVLDLDSLVWATPLQLALPRCMHASVALGDGLVLVAGGRTGTLLTGLEPTANAELIDLANGQVIALPPLPKASENPTAHRLANGSAAVVGERHVSVFDPVSRSWTTHVELRQSRSSHASVLLADQRIVVIAGLNRDTIELVDLAQARSVLLADRLPMPLDDLRAILLPDQRIWILGGQHSQTGDTTDATWLLDLSRSKGQRLSQGPSLNAPAGWADAFCEGNFAGGWGVFGGGESQQQNQDMELADARFLNLKTLEVFSLPKMSQPHDDAVAVPVEQGMIVMGGYLIETVDLPMLRSPSGTAQEGRGDKGEQGGRGGRGRRPTASNRVELLLLPATMLTPASP